MATDIDLGRVQHSVGSLMGEILLHFKEGRKITVLVRTPDAPDQDFVMTNDDLGAVVEMIQRRIADG